MAFITLNHNPDKAVYSPLYVQLRQNKGSQLCNVSSCCYYYLNSKLYLQINPPGVGVLTSTPYAGLWYMVTVTMGRVAGPFHLSFSSTQSNASYLTTETDTGFLSLRYMI